MNIPAKQASILLRYLRIGNAIVEFRAPAKKEPSTKQSQQMADMAEYVLRRVASIVVYSFSCSVCGVLSGGRAGRATSSFFSVKSLLYFFLQFLQLFDEVSCNVFH